MRLEYTIEIAGRDGPAVIRGFQDITGGEYHILCDLPEGHIRAVKASMPLIVCEREKIFMNGYQTWTGCPEYSRRDKIRRCHLPRFINEKFGIDRYGDYFFVDYPEKAGVTHGESYCYFRAGQHYRLFGSLDERPGYTLFQYDARAGLLSISRDCEGLRCGGEFHAFDLFYAEGGEDQVFDRWFAAMGVKPRTTEKLAGYSSWYNRYQNIDEGSILSDLAGCAALLKSGDLFQIDDGWQPYVGDWLSTNERKFPRGLKPIAEDIHRRGLKAGLWLAPFVCQKGSEIYKKHPDWLLQVEGKNWYCGHNWGGFYALDIDNPQVVAYLERSFRQIFDDWGFDLVKLDFLYAAAPFGSDRESRAGRMIRAMELLRRFCGDKLILGCGVPLMPAFGLVDYCRISCDVGLDWANSWVMRRTNREYVSTRNAILNSIFRRQLNGRAFLNDPDVFFLREDNLKLSRDEKFILATVNSLFGGLLLCSDDMSKYSPEARALYARLLENRDAAGVQVDADDGLSVSYTVSGIREKLEID